ncbi:hypothetical protein C8N46_10853 [Kordia periserrulae]|uniref:YhhN-like protein n=1 Tax=Kordia periserrulae TaxID=701523 RepID=A0A2T6BUK1_9FLAO|nr:hypothetical protein [Kordia periserrulae]PTX59743.1 hypothetical protein C8N46_10853 [Kordia periserrulae]
MNLQKILSYLYFSLMVLDALVIVFPNIIERQYITYLPLPVLMLLYFSSMKKINWMYVVALIATFAGIVAFKTVSHYKMALIFYTIGTLLYVMMTLKSTVEISIKTIFKVAIPFLFVYLVPLISYYDVIKMDIFNYILGYVFSVGLFFFISVLIYVHKRTKGNLWLLISGIVFAISTIITGYYLFKNQLIAIRVCIVFAFLFMHYAMYRHVISQEKEAIAF